jgi:hypothetical protein
MLESFWRLERLLISQNFGLKNEEKASKAGFPIKKKKKKPLGR